MLRMYLFLFTFSSVRLVPGHWAGFYCHSQGAILPGWGGASQPLLWTLRLNPETCAHLLFFLPALQVKLVFSKEPSKPLAPRLLPGPLAAAAAAVAVGSPFGLRAAPPALLPALPPALLRPAPGPMRSAHAPVLFAPYWARPACNNSQTTRRTENYAAFIYSLKYIWRARTFESELKRLWKRWSKRGRSGGGREGRYCLQIKAFLLNIECLEVVSGLDL